MSKIKIYLDNCCFNRPYDDQKQHKIFLETEAKLFIQQRIKNGEFDLIWSFILDYENSANPDIEAKKAIQLWENIAIKSILLSPELQSNAKIFNNKGFGIKDSLHIACAIESGAKYFLTTDKGILNKKHFISKITILNPVDFIVLEENL
ncbi:MAG TPA: PIN domain-containing protein [Spirochaetota bacterium]|jgi:hypothetical protein|nr:MAG: hypothetical protein BWX91_00438 [Spirochaetes bacterium ADurb.Bin133]HNZ26169.1 PIN domain-containing protein [Spirochaetota bacterium]HPY86604.1 PIN domain-containing protein [Spirochaetota bacterium]HQB60850.1 PIN domain-containing protein [Spirochaetota bacterium]